MPQILALMGGEEFTAEMISADEFLLSYLPSAKVAILPTAAGQEPDREKWIAAGVAYFASLGALSAGLDMKDAAAAADPRILNALKEFNFYYFSGGDPDYLLTVLKDSPAWRLIHSRYQSGEAILAGSSAGAMVMGRLVWAKVYKYINHGLVEPWEPGLEVTNFGILPHFDAISRDFSADQIAQMTANIPNELKLVGIDEATAYINVNGDWSTHGAGKVHIPAYLNS